MLFHFSQARTLSSAHVLFVIPSYIFLKMYKVSETDHAVTQKLTAIPPLILISLNLLRVNASAIPHMVKYAICACQSRSEFRVNPHEYVTLSA